MSDANFTSKLRTCLGFNGNGEKAAEFYVSLIPDSHIQNCLQPDPDGPVLVIEFTLAGAPFMILNGGPQFEHSMAASISVLTKDQAETDALWEKLTADGGEEKPCGWLIDKYGVSWQIIPEALAQMNQSSDADAAMRAREAMFKMKKIDIAALKAAYNNH